MKLSQIPEFRAQKDAQDQIQEEESTKQQLDRIEKQIKEIKLLISSLLMGKK